MKTRLGLLAVLLYLATTWLTARPAYADEPVTPTRTSDQMFRVYSGFNYMGGSQGLATLQREDIYGGVGIRLHPLFEIGLSLHEGNTAFAFHVHDPTGAITLDANMRKMSEPWLDPEVRLQLLRTEQLTLHLFADIELPFGGNGVIIDRVQIMAPELGNVNATQFIRQHVNASYRWSSFSVGITAHLELGRFEPRVDLGIRRFYGSINLDMDPKIQNVLSLIKQPNLIQSSYPVEYASPIAGVGLDYRLWKGLSLSISGTALPTSDGWFFGASGSTTYRF